VERTAKRDDDTAAALARMQAEQARAYQEAVLAVERRLGVDLPRFRGVEFCVAGYEKPKDLGQAPYYRRFPDLTAKPWWDREAWPAEARAVLARFEEEERAIREEFEAGIARARSAFRGQVTGYFGVADRWLSYALVTEDGKPVPEAFAAFPRLAALLGDLVAGKWLNKTYFALMMPGVHLAEHCGGHNIALRMHFALRIPEGDAAIRVGGTLRRWENGKQLFFDDTFVHEAWNRTGEDRYVLLMRILHPELSPIEREAYFLIEDELKANPTFLALKAEIEARQNKPAPAAPPPAPRAKRKLPLAPSFGPPAIVQAVEQAAVAIFAEGRGADGAVELGAEAGAWADDLTDEVRARLPPARALACAEGCAHCCHLKVLATPPEVLRLVAHLRATRSKEELQPIRERVAEADRKTRGLTAAERAAERLPCPLLEDGRCIAYEARPLACRGINSFDARACERTLDHPEEAVPLPLYQPQVQIADAVRTGVAVGAGRSTLDGRLLELNAGLRIALEDSGAGKVWVRGKNSFAPARDREIDRFA
jgi:Fe-S-cluster containining protein